MTKCEDHPLNVDIIEEPLGGGIKVHALLLCLAAAGCAVGCLTSGYLIFKHARNFTRPAQQRQIIRILLMVPIYSIVCLISIELYRQHVYLGAIYEFYESLVIAAFFLLLCQLLYGDFATIQREFANIEPKRWIIPIRFIVKYIGRNKEGHTKDGSKWFNASTSPISPMYRYWRLIICVAITQFCVIKFLGALLKCITEAADVYCKESTSPSHAKIYIMVIEIFSLTSAMMCLLQFYTEVKDRIAQHQPMLKFLSIKLVIVVFYMQTFIFGMLTKPGGLLEPTPTVSHPSWAVGVPNTILCFEMALVSIFHLYAFPYQPYVAEDDQIVEGHLDEHPASEGGNELQQMDSDKTRPDSATNPWGMKSPNRRRKSTMGAILEALSFKDILQGIQSAFYWFFVARRQHRTRLP